MLQVPSTWKCATRPCVCVEFNGCWWLCHVMAVPHATTRYTFEASIHIPASHAATFVRDNTEFTETRRVHWRGCGVDDRYHFATAQDAADDANEFHLHALQPVYHATSVTLSGQRLDSTRTALSFLSAAVVGRFVCVGARVQTALGPFTVQDMTLRDGYRGVALVRGDSRIRLNSPGETTARSVAVNNADEPVSLGSAVRQLTQLLTFAESRPGQITGVIVRGPHGCGVRTTVSHCLSRCIAATGAVFQWSPSMAVEVGAPARVIALVLPEASRYFSVEEPEAAKLAIRRLTSDAVRLASARNGFHPSVVVLAASHDYSAACAKDVMESFFSSHVVIAPPDLEQRAALLASRRGGCGHDWIQEAQTLVGKTRLDVLAIADTPSWHYTPPFKTVKWSEIGGIPDVKDRLYRALVWPQQHPDQLRRFGITAPKGVLLYGPPGCAKTTLVKALCSEGKFAFIYLDSASVLSAFVGESEQMVRDVFARAAQQAPCLVFFDEVEVIGRRRSSGQHETEQTRLLSTLLTEMDGFAAARGVCFIGATNVPSMIDDALLRPGRFDYLVYVPLPTLDDRKSILALHLSQTRVDLDALASATEGFSGADLKSLCSSALLQLLRSAECAPESLQDEEIMTQYLLKQASVFPRTEYDMSLITKFHESHSTN